MQFLGRINQSRLLPLSTSHKPSSRLSPTNPPPSSPNSIERRTSTVNAAALVVDVAIPAHQATIDANQASREGSHEAPLVQLQANKLDDQQPSLTTILPSHDISSTADVIIVGCGPSGLALAAEIAKRGVAVTMVGVDGPLVNNYGVWKDEFASLGLEDCLDAIWDDALCYFKEGKEVRVGRAYGRVCRRRLRAKLLEWCVAAEGVSYHAGEVVALEEGGTTGGSSSSSTVTLADGTQLRSKSIILASGGAAGRFLKYEEDAPQVAAQTAYGIEADVEGYEDAYDPNSMLFMDFRRHHSGLYNNTALRQQSGKHPNGGDGLWGTEGEVPSFLYAMPLGNKRVFLEETCLVARPALPFAVLKRRLERRCAALGVRITKIHEEEWSYIPTGGPLPLPDQPWGAFGAAANLVHPATGYSLARSLREAPGVAEAVVKVLKNKENSGSGGEGSRAMAVSEAVWNALWNEERRRQASFHVFGMELLCTLDLEATSDFFTTFFNLPDKLWRGFLASNLSSTELLGFALVTFAIAPLNIKSKLVGHMVMDPSGAYMLNKYINHKKEDA